MILYMYGLTKLEVTEAEIWNPLLSLILKKLPKIDNYNLGQLSFFL